MLFEKGNATSRKVYHTPQLKCENQEKWRNFIEDKLGIGFPII